MPFISTLQVSFVMLFICCSFCRQIVHAFCIVVFSFVRFIVISCQLMSVLSSVYVVAGSMFVTLCKLVAMWNVNCFFLQSFQSCVLGC